MEKILIFFTEYKNGKPLSNKYLDKLQYEEELNFVYIEIYCNGKNPIVDKYQIKKIPTYVLLEKIEGKDEYKEIDRIIGKASNDKLLRFLSKEKWEGSI